MIRVDVSPMTGRLALIDAEIMRCKVLIQEHVLRAVCAIAKMPWSERLHLVQQQFPIGFSSLQYRHVENFLNENINRMVKLYQIEEDYGLQIGSIMKSCRDFITREISQYINTRHTSLYFLLVGLRDALNFTDNECSNLKTKGDTNVFMETILGKAGDAILVLETKSANYYDKAIGPGETDKMRLIGKTLKGE